MDGVKQEKSAHRPTTININIWTWQSPIRTWNIHLSTLNWIQSFKFDLIQSQSLLLHVCCCVFFLLLGRNRLFVCWLAVANSHPWRGYRNYFGGSSSKGSSEIMWARATTCWETGICIYKINGIIFQFRLYNRVYVCEFSTFTSLFFLFISGCAIAFFLGWTFGENRSQKEEEIGSWLARIYFIVVTFLSIDSPFLRMCELNFHFLQAYAKRVFFHIVSMFSLVSNIGNSFSLSLYVKLKSRSHKTTNPFSNNNQNNCDISPSIKLFKFMGGMEQHV